VDTRAAREIEDLIASLGVERILSHGGNATLTGRIGRKTSPFAHSDPRCERQSRHRQSDFGAHPRRYTEPRSRASPPTKHIFDTYAEAGAPPSTIAAVGGGLRNRIWTQATSEASGLRQEAREISVGASYGDTFLSRLAIGEVSGSAIKQRNPAAFTIEPDPRHPRVHEERYATFRKLYPRIRDLMEELGADSETEMSRAD
jgi:hypothetical protein